MIEAAVVHEVVETAIDTRVLLVPGTAQLVCVDFDLSAQSREGLVALALSTVREIRLRFDRNSGWADPLVILRRAPIDAAVLVVKTRPDLVPIPDREAVADALAKVATGQGTPGTIATLQAAEAAVLGRLREPVESSIRVTTTDRIRIVGRILA